jgi:hypothetical protein
MQVGKEFLPNLHTRLVCRLGRSSFPTCILDSHLHRVTYTRSCIDTIGSPGDEYEVAQNM